MCDSITNQALDICPS